MIVKYLFEVLDFKKEFGDILVGIKEVVGRNFIWGFKIFDFFKDGGLIKLVEMGSILNFFFLINFDSVILVFVDRMKING